MSTALQPEDSADDRIPSIVRERALIDRLRAWINGFDATEKTFGDFEQQMVQENSAFFALVKAKRASDNLLSWYDGLMAEADASGYFIGS
jgi:hypothetical protein